MLNVLLKVKVLGLVIGLGVGFGARLDGAIGCIAHVHTPDHWDISQSVYQNCSCDCASPVNAQGYCPKCGHLGRLDRGYLTAQVEKVGALKINLLK